MGARRVRLLTALASLAVIATFGLAGGAAASAVSPAASVWKLQTATPFAAQGAFLAVSCPTGTTCVAVGHRVTSAFNTTPVAEIKSTGTWRNTTVPMPAGATIGQLDGVSCAGAGSCIAVGSYSATGAAKPFAERWNGTAWSVLTVPLPSGTHGAALVGVSCASTTACIAVGHRTPQGAQSDTLAEQWNGTKWAVLTTKNPYASNALTGVSCTATTSCMAVGTAGDGVHVIAEQWNGSTWTVRTPVATGTHPELAAVSCVNASTCTAVGDQEGQDGEGSFFPVAERWNGSTWKLQTTPIPDESDRLTGVACRTTTTCLAVGASQNIFFDDSQGPMALRFSGGSWSSDSLFQGPNEFTRELDGISCSSNSHCTAVGSSSDRATVRSSDFTTTDSGATFSAVPTADPTGPVNSQLSAVSCVSANACWAPGTTGTNVNPLMEHYNGSTWKAQALDPSISFESGVDFTGISCTSATFCMAVGDGQDEHADTEQGFYEVWDGHSWTGGGIPTPDDEFVDLPSVSCAGPSSCVAVGDDSAGALIATWNGTSWSDVDLSGQADIDAASLSGVSCTTSTSCTAVGQQVVGSVSHPFIETLSGGTWTAAALTNAAGASGLNSVSCPTATNCTAVGTGDSDPFLIEHLAAGQWTKMTAAGTSGFTGGRLNGVSCGTASACTAVGAAATSSQPETAVILRLAGGTWSVSPAAALPPQDHAALAGVSCRTATACTTVGAHDGNPTSQDFSVPLVEASS